MPDPALPSPGALAARAPSGGTSVPGADNRLAGLQSQRSRLVTIITEDLRRRIEGLATQYHWTLVAEGRGVDLTSRAADLLREQFKPVNSAL